MKYTTVLILALCFASCTSRQAEIDKTSAEIERTRTTMNRDLLTLHDMRESIHDQGVEAFSKLQEDSTYKRLSREATQCKIKLDSLNQRMEILAIRGTR